jgi:hypothetical protein
MLIYALRFSLIGISLHSSYIALVAVRVNGTAVISAIDLRRETKR